MPNLSRRDFLATGGALAGSAMLAPRLLAGDPPGGGTSRPNVILCMTDDQGWGDTGYNGHPELRTPHLDRMAGDGLRFDRFYSGAPVCSPTRGSCVTGRHPYRYGITFANTGRMLPEEITLAEALKPQGYATGHFGKWHLGTLTTKIEDANRGRPGNEKDYAPPWEHGFDACFSTESKVPTYWEPGAYERYGTRYWTGADEPVPAEGIVGDDSKIIMDHALPFIRQASERETPFLAVIWFHAPHKPVVSAPPYTDGYTRNEDYYGCLTAVDEQMGRLRAELKKLGIEDDTMLWFCSDNGPEGKKNKLPGSTGGLRGRKRSLYEGGIRVPGLLVWPSRVGRNRAVSTPCSTSDYFPTVLDCLGHRIRAADQRPYDGISLMPLIAGEMNRRPRPIAFESRKQLALIDNRYKLYSDDLGKRYELYDLIEDRRETTDLAKREPGIVKRMAATLETWRESCTASGQGQDY